MKKPYRTLHAYFISEGLNCGDIARAIGISPQAMSAKMSGKSYFTAEEIAKIGHVLNIPAEKYYPLFIEPIQRSLVA